MRVFFWVALFALSGCAAPSVTALKYSKQDFAAQNYGEAFNHLRKAVKYHDRRVEYALGYCYYYGIGTKPDPYYARYYISRSAWQLYRPAMRAMDLFYQPMPTFAAIARPASNPRGLSLSQNRYEHPAHRTVQTSKQRSVNLPAPQHAVKHYKSIPYNPRANRKARHKAMQKNKAALSAPRRKKITLPLPHNTHLPSES